MSGIRKRVISQPDDRLEKIETQLNNIEDSLKKIYKEIDMAQKIVHVEGVTNSIQIRQDLRDDIKKMITELKGDLYTKIDPLLGEIVDAREDRVLTSDYIKKLQLKIEKVESRVNKLEQA